MISRPPHPCLVRQAHDPEPAEGLSREGERERFNAVSSIDNPVPKTGSVASNDATMLFLRTMKIRFPGDLPEEHAMRTEVREAKPGSGPHGEWGQNEAISQPAVTERMAAAVKRRPSSLKARSVVLKRILFTTTFFFTTVGATRTFIVRFSM